MARAATNSVTLRDFSGGETTIARVGADSARVLARCSGYRCEKGYLEPDDLAAKVNTGPPVVAWPEQTPFAFVRNGETILVCRDINGCLRELVGGVWSAAGPECAVLAESVPVRVGNQIIFARGGQERALMIYEPESATTKLRPLGMKSPSDYLETLKPAVTPSVLTPPALFDCNDGEDWVGFDGHYTVVTETGKATLTLDSDSAAGVKAFTKSLVHLDPDYVSLADKAYTLLDIRLQLDSRAYDYPGLFVNNSALLPSGYVLSLYSNTACSELITSFHIPRLDSEARVNRIAFKIDSDATVKGVSIDTASFYTPPEPGATYILTVYSGVYSDDWSHKGAFVMPEVVFGKSPIASAFEAVQPTSEIVSPPAANLLENASFEAGGAGVADSWTGLGLAAVVETAGRSGARSIGLSVLWDGVFQTAIPVTAGRQYRFEAWHYGWPSYQAPGVWHALVQPMDGATPIGAPIPIPSSGGWQVQLGAWTKATGIVTIPAGASSCVLTLQQLSVWPPSQLTLLDDVGFYPADPTTAGAAYVLQTFSEDLSGRIPGNPLVHYACCYAGRDRLAGDDYDLMVSNPADTSAPDAVADPWRTQSIALVMPTGVVSALELGAAGTDYAAGDILEIVGGGGRALVRVRAIFTGGAVADIELVARGSGYSTGAGQATQPVTGSGSGCTIDVVSVTDQAPIDEYGDYLTHVAFYRQLYDGATDVWLPWEFVGSVPIATSVALVDAGADAGADAEAMILSRAAPAELEFSNPAPSPARQVASVGGRVYAGCLDWDAKTQTWTRPATVQISGYRKNWSFPSLADELTLATDGAEFECLESGGSLVGLAVLDEDVLVFLDTALYHLRGDNPITGWRSLGRVGRRLKSGRSLAVCDRAVVFHDGEHFCVYSNGAAAAISVNAIDSDLIDWSLQHNAVYCRGKYVFFCSYGLTPDETPDYALLIFDLNRPGWRVRRSDALDTLVGICTDGEKVYGVTFAGDVIDLFGGSADYPAGMAVREVWTQYVRLAPHGTDVVVDGIVLETEVQTATDLDVVCRWTGAKNGSRSFVKALDPSVARQSIGLNVQCETMAVELTYEGQAPPTIYAISISRGMEESR